MFFGLTIILQLLHKYSLINREVKRWMAKMAREMARWKKENTTQIIRWKKESIKQK